MNIRVAVSLCILMCAQIAHANTCRQVSKVCIDSTEPKVVNGTSFRFADVGITDSCWEWKSTYECVDSTATDLVDYCKALTSVPGCSVTSSTCTDNSTVNGSCNAWTKTYHCGDQVSPTSGVIQLDNSYTVTYDQVDTSACASYASNPSCQLAQKVCVDGPGTKNIDGLNVYKDCWQWKEDYSCLANNPADYCVPLKQAGCTIQSSVCTANAFTGACIEKDHTYSCGAPANPLPTNVIFLDATYTIVSDQTNNSQCQSLDNNPNCTLASKVCTEGPSTKNINGLDVYKDCWAWKKDYSCASTNLTSTCQEFKDNALCTETGTSCVSKLPDGSCGLLEHQFKCADSAPTTTTQTDCGNQTFCIAGDCFETGYKPDGDIGDVITQMEILRQASNYDIFVGESGTCHKNLIKNCCKTQGGGQGGRNDVIATTIGTTLFKVGVEEVKVWGSKYVFEGLMNSGSEMLQEYAMSLLNGGSLGMSGSFTVWGAEFAVTTEGIAFVGFDPTSLAISIATYIVMDLMTCEQDEQLLGMKRGQGLCHEVGSWCDSKVLGVCLSKKEGWCCFPSKLGRIVNQQGRNQIGKSWGDPESPDCSGFTTDELKKLRFDRMDLSEFVNDIIPKSVSSSYAKGRLEQKAKSYYDQ